MLDTNNPVKLTQEYELPDKYLKKEIYEYALKKSKLERIALYAQIITAGAVIVSLVAIAVGFYQFKQQQSDSANQTLDQQRQTTLDMYIDSIQDMILHDNLYTNDKAQTVAAARTFTVLRYLDGYRKALLIRFLDDVYLIGFIDKHGVLQQQILYLNGIDLSGAVFSTGTQRPNLRGVYLNQDNLYGANLSGVDLSKADLSYTYLEGADLSDANLSGASVLGARYNKNTIKVKDAQGNTLTLKPTLWPQGFNPKAAGAICDDC